MQKEEIDYEYVLKNICEKVDRMMENIGDKSPHVCKGKVYDDMRIDWWTSGFWPGMLWVLYDITKDEKYKNEAWHWDEKLETVFVRENNLHHDVGFQFLPTAVIKYKLTGDQDARRRGLFAANFLAGRFNIAGNFLRAWNQEMTGWAIIDSMMNISILFWAAEEIQDLRFKHIAVAHAQTVLKHFMREDGTVRHIVSFDAETGEFIEALGGQGYAPHSSWSRGQSWAIYGFSNTYKYTGDIQYLNAAKSVANAFITKLDEDSIPLWDFNTVLIEGEPKDTSAAACAASGLLELAAHLDKEEGEIYRRWALKIINSLIKNYTTFEDEACEGLLLEATGNKPNNDNVNVSLIYGDYYFIECIAKLKGWSNSIF